MSNTVKTLGILILAVVLLSFLCLIIIMLCSSLERTLNNSSIENEDKI